MESLARMVELASQQADNEEDLDYLHGDVMWFGADGEVKLIHEACGSVVCAPAPVWIRFLLYAHPPIGGL